MRTTFRRHSLRPWLTSAAWRAFTTRLHGVLRPRHHHPGVLGAHVHVPPQIHWRPAGDRRAAYLTYSLRTCWHQGSPADLVPWIQLPAPLAERRRLGRQLQAVFQNPNTSLNPSNTVGRSLAEPMRAQGIRSRQEVTARTAEMLQDVGMDPGAAARYPRDFSGGQRQRISIAGAIMTEPRVVICDESVRALDLSVQAQILNLLAVLRTSTASATCSSRTTCPWSGTSATTSRSCTETK